MLLIQYSKEKYDIEIEKKIIALENTAWPQNTEEEVFPSAPNTYVSSFVLIKDDQAICHAGIRKSTLFHKGQEYSAYGLSEVVTHPDYRKQGFASEIIKKAAQFIIAQKPDISIFTCEQKRISFYERGGWKAVKGACFVGGTKEKPFRSDYLHLVTLIRFISLKGQLHEPDFENTDIIFELGENQLW